MVYQVKVEFNFSTFKRGQSTYKFNVQLLSQIDFVNATKTEIKRIKDLDLEPILKWEYLKSAIKSLGKSFGRAFAARKKRNKAYSL